MSYQILCTGINALLVAGISLGALTFKSSKTAPPSVVGITISDFNLRNVDGKYISLKSYPKAKGFIVIFTCNHCPFAKLYTKRINELNAKYSPLGVPVLAINSMDTVVYGDEGFANMRERSSSAGFNFPYLYDSRQTTGKAFQASYNPQAYVVWKQNNKWRIVYSGAIDDNGADQKKVTKMHVDKAVKESLQGMPVSIPETRPLGCALYYRK